MFVDASAIVAIIAREPNARDLTDRLEASPGSITSPVAIYEAVLAIRRKRIRPLREVRAEVETFLKASGVVIVAITPEDADRALVAHERYGKGTGHPARLNMGDCFAYAVAEGHGLPLLYKGDDFARTDLG